MKKDLSRKILCSILAAGLCGTASLAMAANSGGAESIKPFNPSYVGNNSTGSNNEVYFDDNGSNTSIYVVGGYAASGEASSNSLTVKGTTVSYVYGGYVKSGGTANNNSVVISDSTVNGYLNGGYAAGSGGTANNNSVVISDSTVSSSVYGGFASGGTANNNSVVISDSTVSSSVYGGNATGGTANNNSVVISGGSKVQYNIYGGFASGGTANNNSVVISDSTVRSQVYGGYAAGSGGTANNNSVTIAGSSDLTAASLYGRDIYSTGTGNKLVLIDFKGKDGTDTSVKSLNNFDSIEVKALGDDKEYTAGQELTLLTATNDTGTKINNCKVGENIQYALLGTDRVAVEVKGNAAIEGDNVTFTVEGMQASSHHHRSKSRRNSLRQPGNGSSSR